MKHALKMNLLRAYKFVFRLVYQVSRKTNDKITIINTHSSQLDGNLLYIYRELMKEFKEDEIVVHHASNKMNLGLFKDVSILAKSRFVFLDDYYLPLYLIGDQKRFMTAQVWHAAGAFKKFGLSTIGTRFGPTREYLNIIPVHSYYDHIFVSSTHCVPFFKEAFHAETAQIHPIGPARIDLFSDREEMERIRTELEIKLKLDPTRKIILLAPTYRAQGAQQESKDSSLDIIKRHASDFENTTFLYKKHPYAPALQSTEQVIVVENEIPINHLMLVADAMVTDYSSAIFEYALLRRPYAHFVPDRSEYTQNRGLYEDLSDISCGAQLEDEDSLVRWISQLEKGSSWDTDAMVRKYFTETENVTSKMLSVLDLRRDRPQGDTGGL